MEESKGGTDTAKDIRWQYVVLKVMNEIQHLMREGLICSACEHGPVTEKGNLSLMQWEAEGQPPPTLEEISKIGAYLPFVGRDVAALVAKRLGYLGGKSW